jgi:hypothetical protein
MSRKSMQTHKPTTLSWPQVLAALKSSAGESVLIRDGKVTEPADTVRNRPAAKGTELCLFSGETPASRVDLVQRIESLANTSGRRFMTSARANVNKSYLLIESVGDEQLEETLFTVVKTRRPVLGYNPSQQTGSQTTFRNKRIKTG